MTRITIDPITRIEGHLRIDCEVDGGKVTKAWSSGQMWRGIELILKDRDPRDAWIFTQRICGVCTTVHAITSVRAVENALESRSAAQRPVYPQHDRRGARHTRPYRAFLSARRARLGRHRLGAQGRSGGGRQARGEPVRLQGQQRPQHPVGARQAADLRRQRQSRRVRLGLLGPPGDEAAAGRQPAGGDALHPGARRAAHRQQDRHHPGIQDAAHPEPRRRRGGERDQSQ